MYHQPLLMLLFIVKIFCHVPRNNSDVIVTYSGHAEAVVDEQPKPKPEEVTLSKMSSKPTQKEFHGDHTTNKPESIEDNTEGVLFVPNNYQAPPSDDEDFLEDSVSGIMNRKTIEDILRSPDVHVETESPTKDILFISGKNNELENINPKPKKETKSPSRRNGKDIEKVDVSLDCKNLDCNNTLKSVCGRKTDKSKYRYRLFLNDCYFRKVNCGFKYKENRYIKISSELCRNIGAHYTEIPIVFKPQPLPEPTKHVDTRRTYYSSRRSLTMSADGQFCSHPCPVSCPDEYDPQCAVSASGRKRVFVNHCKLDQNSCSYGVVWHSRPLALCVGGKKADMTQNRVFISWMQKVGIVDNKGRLVLS